MGVKFKVKKRYVTLEWPLFVEQCRFRVELIFCRKVGRLHCFCVKLAMLKKRTVLSFEQCASCRALAVELVRQNANCTYRKQNGHKSHRGPGVFGQPA